MSRHQSHHNVKLSAIAHLLFLGLMSSAAMSADGLTLAPGATVQTANGKSMLNFLDKGRSVSLEVTPQSGRAYVHTFAPNKPQYAPGSAPSTWIQPIARWIEQCTAQPATVYSYVWNGVTSQITLANANAPKHAHTWSFSFADDCQNHRTTLTVNRAVRDPAGQVPIDPLKIDVNHTAGVLSEIPQGTIFSFDGYQLYEPIGKIIRYTCPAFPATDAVHNTTRPMGDVPEYTRTGHSLDVLALKQQTTPDYLVGAKGDFRKVSSVQQDSPYVYADEAGSFFVTRYMTTVCQSMETPEVSLTFNYIRSAGHRLTFKNGVTRTTANQSSLPRGLYKVDGNRWTLVNGDFTLDTSHYYDFQIPAGEQTYFEAMTQDKTVPSNQLIQDIKYAGTYLTVVDLSGRKDIQAQDSVDLAAVLRTIKLLDTVNLADSGTSLVNNQIDALRARTGMRRLYIDRSGILDPAFTKLAGLTNLVELSAAENTLVTTATARAALTPLVRLKKLNLFECRGINPKDLSTITYLGSLAKNYLCPPHFVGTALEFAGGTLSRKNEAVGIADWFTLSLWFNPANMPAANAKHVLFSMAYAATEEGLAGQNKIFELAFVNVAGNRNIQISVPKVTTTNTTKPEAIPNPKMKEETVDMKKEVPDIKTRRQMYSGKKALPAGVSKKTTKKGKHKSTVYFRMVPDGPTTRQVAVTTTTLGADSFKAQIGNTGWQHVVLQVDPRAGATKAVVYVNGQQKLSQVNAHLQGMNKPSTLTLGDVNLRGVMAEVACFQGAPVGRDKQLFAPADFAVKDSAGVLRPIGLAQRPGGLDQPGFRSFYLTGADAANLGKDCRNLGPNEATHLSPWTVSGAAGSVKQKTGGNIFS